MDAILDLLLKSLEPPTAFERTGLNFWNDEHISLQLLSAHLDAGFDGASRTPAFMDQSVDWIASQAPPTAYPALLDLGCGPGLYAARLAGKGYRVTGVDDSRRSIAYATEQAGVAGQDIDYRVADYLTVKDSARYNAALLIYCDYGALSPTERKTLMANVHAWLLPGGRFILDVFTPHKLKAFREERHWQARPKGGFWSGEPHLAIQNNLKYAHRVSLEQAVILTDTDVKTYNIWNQYFTREMLAGEALAAGFSILEFYDDAKGAPYTGDALTMSVVLEK